MSKNFVHTCYGCPHFYTDKGEKYSTRHCDVDYHWDCEYWKKFIEEKNNYDM